MAIATLPLSCCPFRNPERASSSSDGHNHYLNRQLTANPHRACITHSLQSAAWKLISTITFVASGALMATTLVFAGITLPCYLPLVLVSISTVISPLWGIASKAFQKGNEHSQLALIERGIAEEWTKLKPKTLIQFRAELRQAGIPLSHIKRANNQEELNKFKIVFARYIHWDKYSHTLKNEANQLRAEIAKETNLDLVREKRKEILSLLNQSLVAKTNSAFMHGLIIHPFYQGNLDTLCSFNASSPEDIYLGQVCHDPEANKFLTLNGERVSWIDRQALTDISIPALAERLFSGQRG